MRKQIQNISIVLSLTLVAQFPLSAQSGDYCWKDSKARGAGTIPSDCSFSQEKQGLLCYDKCPANYTGASSICSQNCPAGFVDDGLFCRKPGPYGRGAGYAWQIQDGFSSAGMLARCQSAEGVPCEMGGAIAYPTCKANFHAVGYNICSPDCPAGMTDIGVSCAKQTTTRPPITANCGANKVYDTGLCYTPCPQGYVGVGPVCWGSCPADKPISCGAGCARDGSKNPDGSPKPGGGTMDVCATVTNDQVLNVVQAIANIAIDAVTAGVGGEVVEGLKTAANVASKTLAKTITKDAARTALKTAAKSAGKEIADKTVESWTETLVTYDATSTAITAAGGDPPDFDFTNLDPLGIAQIVQAYNHAVCAPPPANATIPGYSPTAAIPAPTTTDTQAPRDWLKEPGSLAVDIAVTSGGTAWVTTSSGGIYRMKPGENDWTRLPGIAVRVAAGDGNNVWVVNSAGNIYRWNAGVANWDLMPGWASDIAVDTAGNAFVVGRNGTLWEMKAGQNVWTALQSLEDSHYTGTNYFVRVAASGNEKILATDDRGYVYKWIGNDPNRPQQNQVWYFMGWSGMKDVAVGPDGTAYMVANVGAVVVNGTASLPQPVDTTRAASVALAALSSGGTERIWAISSDGYIFKYIGRK